MEPTKFAFFGANSPRTTVDSTTLGVTNAEGRRLSVHALLRESEFVRPRQQVHSLECATRALFATIPSWIGHPVRGPALEFTEIPVGASTSAFGISWRGEGVGVNWPGDDWTVSAFSAGISAVSLVAVRFSARRSDFEPA